LNKVNIMLDSGAHSYSKRFFTVGASDKSQYESYGVDIPKDWSYVDSDEFKHYLNDYIEFCNIFKNKLDSYVSLDIIYNPQKSYEIQKYMESCGLNPLPVFHYGEDISWLIKYMEEGYAYIGISGVGQGISKTAYIKNYGDELFQIVCPPPLYLPLIKTHAFSINNWDLINRYPLYSCDAVTSARTSGFGTIFFPKYEKGNWNYLKSKRIMVSLLALKRGGIHFKRLSEKEQGLMKELLTKEGFEIGESKIENGKEICVKEGICSSCYQRDRWNALVFNRVSKVLPFWNRQCVIKNKQFFFKENLTNIKNFSILENNRTKLYLSHWAANYFSTIFYEMGIENRLVSYFYMRFQEKLNQEECICFMKEYLEKGYVSSKKERRKDDK